MNKTGYKVLSIVLAVILVAGIITGAVFWARGNIVFYSDDELEAVDENDGEVEEVGGMIVEEGEESGISVLAMKLSSADYEAYGVSTLAESAYTLTATISPSDVTSLTVSWSIAFANPDSEWASGKTVTDYVTLSSISSSSGDSITVSCLQAFGEQIIITASTRDDSGVSATCTVDYAQRLESMSVTMGLGYAPWDTRVSDDDINRYYLPYSTSSSSYFIGFSITPTYSDIYTLEDTYEKTATVTGNSTFASAAGVSVSTVTYDNESKFANSGYKDISDVFLTCMVVMHVILMIFID